MTDWASNTSATRIARTLRSAAPGRIVVITHSKPDGDAAGSAFALTRALRRAGVRAEVWFVGPLPAWMPNIQGDTPIRLFAGGKDCEPADGSPFDPGEEPAAIAVLDTGSWSQLAELRRYLEPRAGRAVLIDHHLHGDPETAAQRIIDPAAASTTQLVAPVCVEVLGLSSAAHLPVEVAEPLYLGLATDTGWFRQSNTTAEALRLAADLLAAGVVHTKLFAIIEQQGTVARLRLLSRALASLRIECGGKVAIMILRRDDFAASGAERNDTTAFIDLPMTIPEVQVSVLVTEERPPQDGTPVTKLSLRSKPGDHPVDVNELAGRLGGGGHARAAGARCELPVEEAIARLLEAMR